MRPPFFGDHSYLESAVVLSDEVLVDLTPLCPSIIQKFFFYTLVGRGVARRDPTHVTPKIKLCIHTIYQVCHSKDLFGQSTIFGLFWA